MWLVPILGFSQEEKTFKPHLEKKNEIRIGQENYLTSLEYERQMTDHFSLGFVYRRGEPDYYYNEFNLNETLYAGFRGRYYFKDFITHSFFYLFYDDKVKVRYFAESNLGFSRSIDDDYSERYLDSDSNYVIHRVTDNKSNHATGSVGAGFKLLYNEQFTFEFSFGGGQVLTSNDYINYSYFRYGIGFRF